MRFAAIFYFIFIRKEEMTIRKSYKRLVLPLILVVLLLISTLTVTYAWFIEVKRTSSVYFKVGEIEYEYQSGNWNDSFIDESVIVPGMELINDNKAVSIFNKSTISSELRMLITVSYTIDGTKYVHYIGNPNDSSITYSIAKDGDRNQWEYGSGGFWYFHESESSTILPYVPPGTAREIKILESLKLNGDYFGNSISAKNVTIKFTFQAKQSSYAGWTDQEWKELGDITQRIQ